jgi:hypothetical protein
MTVEMISHLSFNLSFTCASVYPVYAKIKGFFSFCLIVYVKVGLHNAIYVINIKKTSWIHLY